MEFWTRMAAAWEGRRPEIRSWRGSLASIRWIDMEDVTWQAFVRLENELRDIMRSPPTTFALAVCVQELGKDRPKQRENVLSTVKSACSWPWTMGNMLHDEKGCLTTLGYEKEGAK